MTKIPLVVHQKILHSNKMNLQSKMHDYSKFVEFGVELVCEIISYICCFKVYEKKRENHKIINRKRRNKTIKNKKKKGRYKSKKREKITYS